MLRKRPGIFSLCIVGSFSIALFFGVTALRSGSGLSFENFEISSFLEEILELTLAMKMADLLFNQISLEMAKHSEEKSAKRSFLIYENVDF